MSTLVDQSDETELVADVEKGVENAATWLESYVSVMRAPPPAEEEPTQEMLSALNHRIRVQNGTPYVDMGVWCPCGRLTARAQKFRTWIPSPSGGYISKELPGPSCFAQWILS
eukprot:705864-Amphidinium_carterae.1